MIKILVNENTSTEYKSVKWLGIHIYWKKLPPMQREERNVYQTFYRSKVLDEGVFLAICGLNMCRDKEFITGVVRLEMARNKLDKAIKYIYIHKLPGCKDSEKSLDLLGEEK